MSETSESLERRSNLFHAFEWLRSLSNSGHENAGLLINRIVNTENYMMLEHLVRKAYTDSRQANDGLHVMLIRGKTTADEAEKVLEQLRGATAATQEIYNQAKKLISPTPETND